MKIRMFIALALGLSVAFTARGQTRHKEFHEDGKTLRREYATLDDKMTLDGEDRYFSPRGVLAASGSYEKGALRNLCTYYDDGRVEYSAEFTGPAGKPVQAGKVQYFIRDGALRYMTIDGRMSATGDFLEVRIFSGLDKPTTRYTRSRQYETFEDLRDSKRPSWKLRTTEGKIDFFGGPNGFIRRDTVLRYTDRFPVDGVPTLRVTSDADHITVTRTDPKTKDDTVDRYAKLPSFTGEVTFEVVTRRIETAAGISFIYPLGVEVLVDGKKVDTDGNFAELFEPCIDGLEVRDGTSSQITGGVVVETKTYDKGALVRTQRFDKRGKVIEDIVESGAANAKPAANDEQVYITADVMPRFRKGNMNNFVLWVGERLNFGDEAYQQNREGRIVVEYVVEKDGCLSEVTVVKAPSRIVLEEVLRVVNSSPKWTPGMKNGVPVRVKGRFSRIVWFKTPPGAERQAFLKRLKEAEAREQNQAGSN